MDTAKTKTPAKTFQKAVQKKTAPKQPQKDFQSKAWKWTKICLKILILASCSTKHEAIPKIERWSDGSAKLKWHSDKPL